MMLLNQITWDDLPEYHQKVIAIAGKRAKEEHRPVYLIGGWLRDFLMGRGRGKECDLVFGGDPASLAGYLQRCLGGRIVRLHSEPVTVRLVGWQGAPEGAQLDVSQLGASLEKDLYRRDFTVNALTADLIVLLERGSAPIIDFLGGLDHLRRRELVLISPEALKDDPIRCLRAFRFWATHHLTPSQQTLHHISRHAGRLKREAAERIVLDLSYIFQSATPFPLLKALKETEVLTAVVPELDDLKFVPAIGYHHLNGIDHTLCAVAMTDRVLAGDTDDRELNRLLVQHRISFDDEIAGGRKRVWTLKMATLLHDIGKPATMQWESDGSVHFYGHEITGSEMTDQICRRLKLARKETETLVKLVRHHMRPAQLAGVQSLTVKALRRIWRDLGDQDGLALVFLSAADLMATRGPAMTEDQRRHHYEVLKRLLLELEVIREMQRRPRLISGHDVMERYRIGPGPLVGEALRQVEEAALEGRVETREEAFQFLDEIMRRKGVPVD